MQETPIRDIVEGYVDNNDEGVVGYKGMLNIRPKYQREFVYKDKQREMVIDTIMRGLPLNVMYWAENEDGTFEVLDGQQRTISFCQYVCGDFSINNKYYHTLTEFEQDKILNYKVMVYIVKGSDYERLEWFRTINIAGERLTEQELLNINYTGEWLSDAKRKFSKNNCVAAKLAEGYVNCSPIRQELLETALKWVSEDGDVAKYMAEHQLAPNANDLWLEFRNIIGWVQVTFPNKRKEMKNVDWGFLYKKYKENVYDVDDLEKKISELMSDDEVTKKKGVYEYVLSGCTNEKSLSLRGFSDKDKRAAYERQSGVCPICKNTFKFEDMDGDHIVAWANGGRTIPSNLQMLCRKCNHEKSNRY